MTDHSYERGHAVYSEGWFYEDTNEPLTFPRRPCAKCGAPDPGIDEPDPCLGHLPGVWAACCGHGVTEFAYVTMDDFDTRAYGEEALLLLESLRSGSPSTG